MDINPGTLLSGPYFPETVRVIHIEKLDSDQFKIEAVGVKSQKYFNPILSNKDVKQLEIIDKSQIEFSGEAESLFLFLESHRIRNAFQFDPHYAVNVSQVDPLPHQIDAVYHHILTNPRIRFLLADDPGAGKTIMAGLLLKELKYRGVVERIMIIAPGHLKDQWLREMKDKFQENFIVVDRSVMRATWGQNIFSDKNQIIVSTDFAKQDDVMFALKDTHWDIVIVDEAHKMAAHKYGSKISRTQRYRFGELISPITNYLLFLTATPHRGDPENFRLLLDLLEPGFFATTKMLAESVQQKDNPLFIRRLKEDLKNFDGTPIFPPRKVETVKFYLSDDEKTLYNAVTEYVEKSFNKALSKEKRNVAFALTILQRRLASSVRAVRISLERRKNKLAELYKKGEFIQNQDADYREEFLEDLEEKERWEKEEELLEKLSSAETIEELQKEIIDLEELIALAKKVEKQEIETKLTELRKVMQVKNLKKSDTKLLIFTEAKDTLMYLVEKIRGWGFSVTFIHGGMDLNQRIQAEHDFRHKDQILVSTEAGGEGINLQFCWLMVNYDIPWNPNRLEQRMGRVHRYGQQHEVHIYNLVALDTREGRILEKLFDKLQKIRDHLGSDRVFDVIGEVLIGKNLKELILDALANPRTMDQILETIEKITDEEAIQRVKEASLEALATTHIDLTKILGEQREAKENKLVPEYIEEYFKRSAKALDIKMKKRIDDYWKISLIPFAVRNQSHQFENKFGKVQNQYKKVAFDKQKAFKGQVEFVAMGHPLLEAIIESHMQKLKNIAHEGAVFIDPDSQKNGVIWFFEVEINDGTSSVVGKRIFAVYQPRQEDKNDIHFVNPAILWDLEPLTSKKPISAHSNNFDINLATSYVVSQGIDTYKQELLERRKKDANVKRKYGIRSLDSLINESEGKLASYYERQMKGEKIPEATIQKEQSKKEGLQKKKTHLEDYIEKETHLYPTDPKLIGAVRVISTKATGKMVSSEEVEMIGMRVAMEYEKKQNRIPEDVHLENLGFDIRSNEEDKYRYIEVKARAGKGSIALTPNEWLMAQRLSEEFWLYVIENAVSKPQLFLIQNPAKHLKPDQEIDVVRYIVKNWKQKSKKVK